MYWDQIRYTHSQQQHLNRIIYIIHTNHKWFTIVYVVKTTKITIEIVLLPRIKDFKQISVDQKLSNMHFTTVFFFDCIFITFSHFGNWFSPLSITYNSILFQNKTFFFKFLIFIFFLSKIFFFPFWFNK